MTSAELQRADTVHVPASVEQAVQAQADTATAVERSAADFLLQGEAFSETPAGHIGHTAVLKAFESMPTDKLAVGVN